MANQLSLSSTLNFQGNNLSVAANVPNIRPTVAGNGLVSLAAATVPTMAAAVPVGGLTGGAASGGWLFVQNNDATNYMQILTATSGTAFARLLPGEFCLLRLDAGLTAPFWQAHTAPVSATLAIFDL